MTCRTCARSCTIRKPSELSIAAKLPLNLSSKKKVLLTHRTCVSFVEKITNLLHTVQYLNEAVPLQRGSKAHQTLCGQRGSQPPPRSA
jgi:phosphoenolpyruvate carboxylase